MIPGKLIVGLVVMGLVILYVFTPLGRIGNDEVNSAPCNAFNELGIDIYDCDVKDIEIPNTLNCPQSCVLEITWNAAGVEEHEIEVSIDIDRRNIERKSISASEERFSLSVKSPDDCVIEKREVGMLIAKKMILCMMLSLKCLMRKMSKCKVYKKK